MEKKTRTILFSIFVILFFIISVSLTLYTQGYRPDFKNKKLTKTGGLFLKVQPKQVNVYLNDKFFKKTDFIFGSLLIENLLPKKYKIKIEKEGYFPWEKNLEVKENNVTEAKYIILFPKKLNFGILFTEIENFWVSLGGKKMIFLEKKENEKFLSLYDLEKKIKNTLIKLPENDFELIDFWLSGDEKIVYLKVKSKEEIKIFSLNLEEIQPKLKETIQEKLPFENIAFKKTEKEIYYLTNSGFIYKSDSDFKFRIQINRNPFPIERDEEYKLEIFGDWLFLKEGEKFFYFNQEEDNFEKIQEEVLNYKISPDNEKLAIFSNNEILVFFLKDKITQPTKQKGEKVFITRFSEKIGDLFWLNSDYLIFSVGNKIKVCEIDDRDRMNIYDLGEFEEPKIFFNEVEKNLYILSKGNLIFLNLLFL